MVKPDLGTKRVCPSCAARFYDLQKRPIECPKCAFTFEPEMLLKQRRTRVPEPAKAIAPVKAVIEDTEDEEAEDDDAEASADDEELEEEIPEADEPLIEADAEDGEEADQPAAEEPVEEEDFEEDIDEEEEDDSLLEEVEEDDVAGIIDADIEKDEP